VNEQHEARVGIIKVFVAWAATLGGMNLAELLQILVLTATLLYTVLQTYVLVRDKIVKRRRERRQAGDTAAGGL
jgi:hypothetical protein